MAVSLSKLHYHQRRRLLDLIYNDGSCCTLSAEFLRVHSPSAEVRGHGQPKLVANKRDVAITQITPVGHYAVKLVFDDGHNTGLYSYPYLQQLADKQQLLWQQYLQQLKQANASREPRIAIKTL
ncbi:gamma-butyrobetaine hydroxylase-like domain-containing protein [Alishewanella longhuensis]